MWGKTGHVFCMSKERPDSMETTLSPFSTADKNKYNPNPSKSRAFSLFSLFFCVDPGKSFPVQILKTDRDADKRENDFHPIQLKIDVKPLLRTSGNDPADHIPGSRGTEFPSCPGISPDLNFQHRPDTRPAIFWAIPGNSV